MRTPLPLGLSALLLAAFIATALFITHPKENSQHLAEKQVIIHNSQGIKHRFTVEIANTPATRAKGLSQRDRLPKNHGMLFLFEQPRPIEMWMKDTPLALDMLFIGKDNRILRIEKFTEPLSETTISSMVPADKVLEINAGLSDRLAIFPGDKISIRP